ncbi:hypothetical protein SLEP1_g32248 [Rubroshorea leprosula]|uniref:Uncharacterized protein n=1 Tax=Rubroshorea leprosula TaxID=152421 RepID=A0AAV5KCN2_9ROSI|nr:hypothetical protein SLEP1_g32248 [Rubroshorea leprosula]
MAETPTLLPKVSIVSKTVLNSVSHTFSSLFCLANLLGKSVICRVFLELF